MELDYNLLFNFTSMFATILFVLTTSTTVFQRLKLRWPLKVNCWFCNNNTKIWREDIDWWLCPSCEQYNGFLKSGDYTYEIPEQYKSPKNGKRYCTYDRSTKANGATNTNDLCEQCNANESLKLLELSAFEPVREKHYDYEAKELKEILEEKYRLCNNCKSTVQNVLQKQARWLAEYKMLLFKRKPFDAIANNPTYAGSVFRIISTILDSTIAYNADFILLPIGGLFFQLCACWVTPAKRRGSDALLAFLWICIIVLLPFKNLKLLKTDIQSPWVPLEYVTQYHVIMMFAFIIGCINILPKYYKRTASEYVSFKKIESPSRDTVSLNCSAPTMTKDSQNFDGVTNDLSKHTFSNVQQSPINNHRSVHPVNSFKPISGANFASIKPTIFGNPTIKQESVTISTPDSIFRNNVSSYKSTFDNYSLNDSLSTLSTLSLSEELPKHKVGTAKIFERKVYGSKSPDLFKKLSSSSSKKFILSPPKLKSVMQASWVAGGYWQEGIDAPSLSRSSSQSSGFGSAGSNFAPSREPSVHEFDRCSLVSDATQSCYVPRQSSSSPVSSYLQQGSQVSLVGSNSSIYNQRAKHASSHVFSPQPLLQSQNYQRNNAVFADHCTQGQRMNDIHTSDSDRRLT